MEYRKLGRTGLKVSQFCLGTMQWGWTASEEESFEVMDAFVAAGGNFIDTADVYSRWVENNPGGVAEEIIGRWMKERGNRHEIILATKVRGTMGDNPNDEGLSRKHIMEAVDASLRRLQTDYIDLYQCHAPDPETPIDETLRALDDLQRAGKVRYVGASNYNAWQLVESLWKAEREHTVRFDSLQPKYNMVLRAEFERDLQKVCQKYEIGVIPYSPLAAGFLTGKYERNNFVNSKRSSGVEKTYGNDTGWRTLEAVKTVARELNTNPGAVALAWMIDKPSIVAPIIGANSPQQLQESLASLDLEISDEQFQRLNEASRWQ